MNDLISRQWLMECVNEGWIKFETEKDENIFIHLVRDIAPFANAFPSATMVFGKWVKDNSIGMSPGGTPGYVCSQCGGSFHLHGAEYPRRKMMCDKCGSINSYPWEKTYEQTNDSNALDALEEKAWNEKRRNESKFYGYFLDDEVTE